MGVDLHCHTKLSDSSMGIDDLIVLAQKNGLEAIAITDHDCQAGNVRGKIIGDRRGLTVIPGVELSAYDKAREKSVSLLCYYSRSPDRLEGLCHKNIAARKRASQFMLLKIMKRYPITQELVLKCATGSTAIFPQHIMHALMECGLTDHIYGDLYQELFHPESPDNILVTPKFPTPAEILAAIHDAGGIAVLSNPGATDAFDILDELAALGLDGVEVWHPHHTPEQVLQLEQYATENRLLMTGGSNFHGMYSQSCVTPGCLTTPEVHMKAFLSYKAQLNKNKAR